MSNKTDILNELKEISPILFTLKENEKPLVVPAKYFEQLADNFMTEINAESGLLASMQKEKIEVPDHYFDHFSDSILSKIKKEAHIIENGKIVTLPKKEHKFFSMFKQMALAASIIGAVIFIKKISEPPTPLNNCEDGIACLTQDEIYQYMNANSQDFDVQQIQEAVAPVLESQRNESVNKEISEKEIEQYLEQHNNIIEAEDITTDIF